MTGRQHPSRRVVEQRKGWAYSAPSGASFIVQRASSVCQKPNSTHQIFFRRRITISWPAGQQCTTHWLALSTTTASLLQPAWQATRKIAHNRMLYPCRISLCGSIVQQKQQERITKAHTTATFTYEISGSEPIQTISQSFGQDLLQASNGLRNFAIPKFYRLLAYGMIKRGWACD